MSYVFDPVNHPWHQNCVDNIKYMWSKIFHNTPLLLSDADIYRLYEIGLDIQGSETQEEKELYNNWPHEQEIMCLALLMDANAELLREQK